MYLYLFSDFDGDFLPVPYLIYCRNWGPPYPTLRRQLPSYMNVCTCVHTCMNRSFIIRFLFLKVRMLCTFFFTRKKYTPCFSFFGKNQKPWFKTFATNVWRRTKKRTRRIQLWWCHRSIYTTLLSIATCTNTITGKGGVGITRHGTKILQTPETKHRRGQRSVQTYFDFDFTETNTNSNLSSSRLGLIDAAASRLRLLVHCIFPAVPVQHVSYMCTYMWSFMWYMYLLLLHLRS